MPMAPRAGRLKPDEGSLIAAGGPIRIPTLLMGNFAGNYKMFLACCMFLRCVRLHVTFVHFAVTLPPVHSLGSALSTWSLLQERCELRLRLPRQVRALLLPEGQTILYWKFRLL